MLIFADDQGAFCLVFGFYFTGCYNSDILPQFRMSQYNSLNVQLRPKFQSGDSFTQNE